MPPGRHRRRALLINRVTPLPVRLYGRAMGIWGKLFGRSSPPDDFWKWFAANAARFTGVPDGALVEELSTQLRRVDPQLVFQIGQNELEISADGIKALIPAVRDLVGAAPSIPGWSVRAFRQPQPGIAVEMGGRSYSAKDVYFTLTRDPDGNDLAIYIAGAADAADAVGGIAFLLLDSTIGELAVMTKIRGIDLHEVGMRPPTAKPLAELPQHLDN
jgi:hypothetical protein